MWFELLHRVMWWHRDVLASAGSSAAALTMQPMSAMAD